MAEITEIKKIGQSGDDEDSDFAIIAEMEQAALRDLGRVMGLVRDGKLRVSDKTGYPSSATTKAIAAVLTGEDFYPQGHEIDEIRYVSDLVGPIRSFAWPMLLQAAKLAVKTGTKLSLSHAGEKSLSQRPHDTLRFLWRSWRNYTGFDEFRRVDQIKGQSGKGRSHLTSVVTRRAAINAALSECAVGEWVDVDELFQLMESSRHDFEVTRDPWELYIFDSQYGSLGHDGFDEWELIQGRYVLCLLFEYAATLGIIDVAYDSPRFARDDFDGLWGADQLEFLSRYDGLVKFRVTPLGAYCFGLSREYAPPRIVATASLTVLPSLRITARGKVTADEQAVLEQIAVSFSECEWSLDLMRIMQTLEMGHDATAFIEFLQARDQQPLPDTVTKLFQEAVQRAVAVKDLSAARLIECISADLAETIAHADATKAFCLRAGDRHLVVATRLESKFRTGLEKLGYIVTTRDPSKE